MALVLLALLSRIRLLQKEMQAILEIERKRRDVLGDTLHDCRLFVPLILRGDHDHLPAEITENCHYLDYSKQATCPDKTMGDDEKTSEQLFRIAKYIKSLCDKMKPKRNQLLESCKGYVFAEPASSAAAVDFQAAPPQPFPGR